MSARTSRFVRVDHAATSFAIAGSSPFDLRQYPGRLTWAKFTPDVDVTDRIMTALTDSSVAVALGMPGSGKTFSALMAGHRWEVAEQQHGDERPAFYAVAGGVDFDAVVRDQWSVKGIQLSRCLWIIDDIHNATNDCEALLSYFEAERFYDRRHRILCVGWSVPEFLKGYNTVPIALSSRSIELALRASKLPVPSPPVRQELATVKTMGLRQILEFASSTDAPLCTADLPKMQRAWLNARVDPLDESQRSLLYDLARLHFVGVQLREAGDPSTANNLRRLARLGLLVKSGREAKHLRVADDEEARAMFGFVVNPSDVKATFYHPLLAFLKEHIDLVEPFLTAAHYRTTADVFEWIGNADADTETSKLSRQFVRAAGDGIDQLLVNPRLSLIAAAKLLVLAEREGLDVTPRAQRLLSSRRASIGADLSKRDVDGWRAAAALSRLASDDFFSGQLRATLEEPSFQDALLNLPHQLRGAALQDVQRFSPDTEIRLQRKLEWIRTATKFEQWKRGSTGASPSPARSNDIDEAAIVAALEQGLASAWRALARLAKVSASKALTILQGLSVDVLNEAARKDPRGASELMSALRGPSEHQAALAVFKRACADRGGSIPTVTLKDRALSDLARFAAMIDCPAVVDTDAIRSQCNQIVREGPSGLVSDLVSIAASWRRCPLRATLRSALIGAAVDTSQAAASRVYSLSLLDPGAAVVQAEQVSKLLLELSDPPAASWFWSLWVLFGHRADLSEQMATPVIEKWQTPDAHSGTKTALSGLLAVILNSPAPQIPKCAPHEYFKRTTSPVLTVCQIVAMLLQEDPSHYPCLTNLGYAITKPLPVFRFHWNHTAPHSRRLMIRVLERALGHCTKPQAATVVEFSKIVADHAASRDGDYFWESDVGARVRVVERWGSSKAAADLVVSHAPQWNGRLKQFQGKGLLEFVVAVTNVATLEPTALDASRTLLSTAHTVASRESTDPALKEIRRLLGNR